MLRSLKHIILGKKTSWNIICGEDVKIMLCNFIYTFAWQRLLAAQFTCYLIIEPWFYWFVAINSAKRLQFPGSLAAKNSIMTKFWSMRCTQKWKTSFLLCLAWDVDRMVSALPPSWTWRWPWGWRQWKEDGRLALGSLTTSWSHHANPGMWKRNFCFILSYSYLRFPYHTQPNLILSKRVGKSNCLQRYALN